MEKNMREIPLTLHLLSNEYKAQTSINQRAELYNAILDTPDGCVVEIGSASGGTTVILAEASKQVFKTVYSVDPYPEELEDVARDYYIGSMSEYKKAFKENILDKFDNVIQFNEELKDCIGKIPDGISVAFVDGLHELSYVQLEYMLLLPKMVKGGIMYFHDMGFYIGQLSDEGGLTKFPEWVRKGEIIEKDVRDRLEALQMMLKIEI
jgi:predicted O-methyltransferase YrrM